ncbi:Alkali-sensitive linkage protein 1 [Lachnellula arida]|uniref:Alkali-sensitive linkage protein 1 n=1 Tax=Lachnellula arida TaxID=1316785 RepID=A0A8T9BBC9_9HELO|nr:Alkali-sensitive linkage protein 1 [Lachnellula arida]
MPSISFASISLFQLCLLASLLTVVRADYPVPRGLPYNDPPQWIQHFRENSDKGEPSNVGWAYSWGSSMASDFPSDLEFVPMLWDDRPEHTNSWEDNVNDALGRGVKCLLSFNEPDNCNNQTCMLDLNVAAQHYIDYMNPFHGRAFLGAPAITSDPNVGMPWLKGFIAACDGRCSIDFYTVHWYGNWDQQQLFHDFLFQIHDILGDGNTQKIWITEARLLSILQLHAEGTTDQQIAFLDYAIPLLDGLDWVVRYAWWWTEPGSDGALTDGNGFPTELGQFYTYRGT